MELTDSHMLFLDEFRTVVQSRYMGTNPSKLIVFNTLIPQGHPRSSRRFGLPPQYQYAHVHIHADEDRYLGTLDRDAPFVTDPAQATIAVELSGPEYHVLLVVRIQTLIEHVCSRHTNVHVPWDEWGRGVVITDIPFTNHSRNLSIHVHGTHVVTLEEKPRDDFMQDHFVRIFDFGRRGRSALSLGGGEVCGTEFKDRKGFMFEAIGEGHTQMLNGVQTLGNGKFYHQVS